AGLPVPALVLMPSLEGPAEPKGDACAGWLHLSLPAYLFERKLFIFYPLIARQGREASGQSGSAWQPRWIRGSQRARRDTIGETFPHWPAVRDSDRRPTTTLQHVPVASFEAPGLGRSNDYRPRLRHSRASCRLAARRRVRAPRGHEEQDTLT